MTQVRRLLAFASIAALLPASVTVAGLNGYRINFTPSEPLGLWRIQKLNRPVSIGDLVFICPPEEAAMMIARQRGYLRSGLCPGRFAPLIKTVVGLAGQSLTVEGSILIDGIVIPHSAVVAFDGKGRPMMPFERGVVPPDNVVVQSPYVGSFDSRYFGPIPQSGILGLAQEVLTYAR